MALDDVDRGILYLLQQDARRITTEEMGERVGVSASTVRNRIEKLEQAGVIRSYHPEIAYDETGLQLHMMFICSAPPDQRTRLADEALGVVGVVRVQEVLNGSDNVHVEVIGTDTDDIGRISDELNSLGLDVMNSKIIKNTAVQPFDHFGQHVVEDEADE